MTKQKIQKPPRKLFEVLINNKPYDIYDIDGKEHEGWNDTPKTWWLYHDDRLPDGLLPPADSDAFKPWNVGIERRLWDIKVKQHNTTKSKWGETQFSNHTAVEMWCNNKLVYAFSTFGRLDFPFAKIQYLQVILSEHCYNFFEPEKENGRKICYYGLPATVKVKSSTWEIAIIPDYTYDLDKEAWWNEYKNRTTKIGKEIKETIDKQFEEMEEDDFNDSKQQDYINWGDALSDGNISWFR